MTEARNAMSAQRRRDPSKRSPAARSTKAPVHSAAIGPNSGYSYSAAGVVQGLYASYAPLAYYLPWETLDYVEILSTYNADYSQAVDNIRTLANSGHELFVDAQGVRDTKGLKAHLEEFARSIQPSSGGIDGVIDKLLDQAAVYGAMCGEWILDDKGQNVIDFADLNPKYIRFFWNENTDEYEPWQKVSGRALSIAQASGQQVQSGCIKLNPMTFHYYSFDAAPGSPYGTPPFIASLEPIGIQRDMVANMSQIVKKIGLLGLVDLTVEQLPPKPGESDDAYASRAGAYLDQYVSAVEAAVRDGGLVHFDDTTLNTATIAGNASGATNIFKQNEELVFSGLKSMPSVQGRSYSTTETYAGVAYDIIIRNTKRYQRACKRMIEAGYWLSAQLAGFNPKKIDLDFHPNKTLHRLQDAQANQLEIKNAAQMWLAGILDQLGFAQALGHDDIKTAYDLPPDALVGTLRQTITDQGNGGVTDTTGADTTGGGKPDNQNNANANQNSSSSSSSSGS